MLRALLPLPEATKASGAAAPDGLVSVYVVEGGLPVTVPAGAHVHLLLDRQALTTAYPRLTISGGKGAPYANRRRPS